MQTGIIVLSVTILLLLNSQATYSQDNWGKTGNKDDYILKTDSIVQYEGQPVMSFYSVNPDPTGYGGSRKIMPAGPYLGKRIRMSGFIRTEEVKQAACFWLRVDGGEPVKPLAFDNMMDRPIVGTTDWKRYGIVLEVPEGASEIFYGTLIKGAGKIWYSGIRFELVGNEVPVTRPKLQ